MKMDSVSFTADGPNALSHIRRVLAGYELDEDADGVTHIEVEIHLDSGRADDDVAQEQQAEPEVSGAAAHDDTPGRIRKNTRHHVGLHALAVMEGAGETPASPKEVAAHIGEHTSYDSFDQKDASSALGRCFDRGLCERERPSLSFVYSMNKAGRLELKRLGVPEVFEGESDYRLD